MSGIKYHEKNTRMQKKKKHSTKKKTVKKTAKKKPAAKKSTKRKAAKKTTAPKKVSAAKPVGTVTHFFSAISVAIVKCKAPLRVGDALYFKGATTDFKETVKSMQYDHKPITLSKKGQEVGMKVKKRVREGDAVYQA